MADFFFFTDVDLLLSQSQDKSFGPVVSSDPLYDSSKNKYRLTSLHSATVNPTAYAVCKGQLIVQEDSTNSTLVNIILKPESQTKNDLPIIKYYIYRGILKNSLTDGTNVINGSNTLTKKILDNNSVSPQKVLGIELSGTNYLNTDPIDNAFYVPKVDFDLWMAFGGWSIGTFDKDNFGFEIVFDTLGYSPTFDIARGNVNVFEISNLSGTPSEAEQFEYKTKKEVVTNYLDPCAFWSSFYEIGLKTRKSTDSVDTDFLPSFSKIKGDEIYRTIIEGGTVSSPQNIYFNKNQVYLDIRNDFNFSFNYFENFDDSLKLSFVDDDVEPTDLVDYYTSGWPILQLNNLPEGNEESFIRISFPINEYMEALALMLTGQQKTSFIKRIKYGDNSFQSFENDLAANYTENSLAIVFPNYDNQIPFCTYLKIKYIDSSRIVAPVSKNIFTPQKLNVFDYIFQPLELNVFFQTNDKIKINTYNEEVYINLLEDFGIDYSANIGFAKDLNNTILFFYLSKRNSKLRSESSSPSYSISRSTNNEVDFFTSYIENSNDNIELENTLVTINSSSVQLINQVKSEFSFFTERNPINFDTEFFSIILSNSDYDTIKAVATTNFTSVYKPYLCFKPIASSESESSYQCSEIFVTGLSADVNDKMELAEFPTGVMIYSFQFDDLI